MVVTEIIYFSILLAGIVIGIIKHKGLQRPAKWVWVLIIYIFIKEVCAKVLAQTLHYNLSFYQYLSVADFLIITLVFYFIPLMKSYRRILMASVLIVVVFYFLNLFIWQTPGKGADTYFKMVKSFFLALFSLLLYYRIVRFADYTGIIIKSSFWLATAVLLFNTFSLFHWGAYNYFLNHNPDIIDNILRPVFIAANYLLYGLLATTIYLNSYLEGQQKSN